MRQIPKRSGILLKCEMSMKADLVGGWGRSLAKVFISLPSSVQLAHWSGCRTGGGRQREQIRLNSRIHNGERETREISSGLSGQPMNLEPGAN